MKLSERIDVLGHLGQYLQQGSEQLDAYIQQTYYHNRWFTVENIREAIEAIRTAFLQPAALEKWSAAYPIDTAKPQNLGLILAGNIPLVGFHDVLCVFIAGHRAKIKLSEKDKFLLKHFVEIMTAQDDRVVPYFEFVERLTDFDAVIATGSNNSARYFDAYFGKYPNIIRRNRNAVAVLSGTETGEQLRALGQDVFQYFGLGCRNVSKLYLPQDYAFEPLLEALHEHNHLVMNDKYKNNFDYGYTLLILNKVPHQANGCILLTEQESLQSRIAQLHYEYYSDQADLAQKLADKREEIQCVVSGTNLTGMATLPFGAAQKPGLTDYADGVDTLAFLTSL